MADADQIRRTLRERPATRRAAPSTRAPHPQPSASPQAAPTPSATPSAARRVDARGRIVFGLLGLIVLLVASAFALAITGQWQRDASLFEMLFSPVLVLFACCSAFFMAARD